jgi:ribonuclease HI
VTGQIKEYGLVEGHQQDERLVVATDASVNDTHVAIAYVSSQGHYGMRAHPYSLHLMSGKHRSTVNELRAVMDALENLVDETDRKPIRVLTDSEDALSYLTRWKEGEEDMPPGYSLRSRSQGGVATLVALQRKVRRLQELSFRLVLGHTGHPLNETADSLAKLGLRYSTGKVKGDVVRRHAPQWAALAVGDFSRYTAETM